MKKIKIKNIVSISIAGAFLIIAVTGTLMYFLKHQSLVSSLHTIFGFLFVGYAIFHLKNNWVSLKSYSVNKTNAAPKKKLKIELLFGIGLLFVFFAATAFNFAPVQYVMDWGNSLRTGQKLSEQDKISYIKVNLNPEGKGDTMKIDIRKGPYFEWPTFAFWLEDTAGNYLQTLYVTSKLAKNNFTVKVVSENGEDVFIDEPETKNQRERPEALPVWSHQYGVVSEKGNAVPTGKNIVPDGYSGATLTENTLLNTITSSKLPDQFLVKMEINHSFDWNEFYTSNRYPDDPIYSGNGKVGQPSLIYQTKIDRSKGRYFAMELVGRGHHSGRNGNIYTDLSEITTAKQLVDRVIIEL